METISYVSVHGGHSGQFCHHATNTLEEIIQQYILKDFPWVGITEHVPAISDELRYPDQIEAGLTADFLLHRFRDYIRECRRLQRKYDAEIRIYTAMEIETYSGYEQFIPSLIQTFQPDYLVGSVHFVDDLGFDYSREQYDRTAAAAGGVDALYCRYFDQQYEMIKLLQPAVVGHFDLIRIFDPEYRSRLLQPAIMERIRRNLALIRDLDLIMDFNLRSLLKGASEPYISRPILQIAREMGIAVVPGDDSHGLESVAAHMETGVAILAEMGFDTNWRQPRLLTY
ncbi:histidinol-phosphatase [Desulfoprunum benzoelyticum]|uniref:Histidinol-phosphatase n=1 Tax=Desulfoprunum benzoelyticum TaxID=1506996 RepID=A0A840UQ12_9BACT|nr:histidinol-phosphatase [Desulfoprunum benzoelyticum]MBB5347872.1 histidinol-phosphatase (PHP family) [Desulfoprunum benzoelyticum]MBM9531742.1 histidinol-phosphatase [Desulfoprunum benzoelyticum]